MTSTLFVEEIKGRTTGTNANKVIVPSGQSLTVGGAFTSPGIDDNADANALTIDSSEKVHIGTASLTSKLNVVGDGNTKGLSIKSGGNGGVNPFQVTWSAGSEGAMLKVDDNGNTHVGIGNLVIGTNGKGIDFSATADGTGANQAELLNDYEEGTWTPTLISGGSVSVSNARYTKIGQMVYVGAYVTFSSIPNDSNELHIGGLPFNSAGSSAYHGAGGVTYVGTFNWHGTGAISGGPTPYSSLNRLYFHRGDGTSSVVRNSALTSLAQFIFGVVYVSDS